MPDEALEAVIEQLARGEVGEVRRMLAQRLLSFGIGRFVIETAAPLATSVGDAWASGRLQVYHEHLFSEILQQLLRGAMKLMPDLRQDASARPRVLLTTVPGEQHGLGLLMAEAMLILSGAGCISLGTQTPLLEVCAAAEAQGADIVGLSFSAMMGMQDVWPSLVELRERLPARIAIWIGGAVARARAARDGRHRAGAVARTYR